ncbi:transposase [Streptomyces sp. NPDC001292]|uniref:IS110 family transposase n=1 Tax=Streptomyces sp. NPDC001292 TaxID=3364558 RepID=UPI0036CBC9B3
MIEDGFLKDAGQIGCRPEALRAWAETLREDDEVALEATGNAEAIALLLRPRVARVVVSNPFKTRAIAEAKVKTDKVDARILAQLLAADFLPPVWLPDERTSRRRRLIARRMHVVRQRTRIKNQVQSILHRNLMPRFPCRYGLRSQTSPQRHVRLSIYTGRKDLLLATSKGSAG